MWSPPFPLWPFQHKNNNLHATPPNPSTLSPPIRRVPFPSQMTDEGSRGCQTPLLASPRAYWGMKQEDGLAFESDKGKRFGDGSRADIDRWRSDHRAEHKRTRRLGWVGRWKPRPAGRIRRKISTGEYLWLKKNRWKRANKPPKTTRLYLERNDNSCGKFLEQRNQREKKITCKLWVQMIKE